MSTPTGPIDPGISALSRIRAIGPAPSRTADAARGGGAKQASPVFAPSAALAPGEAPVDADRVAEIRKAIEQGTYPVIPARVANAMIAAGFLLRSGK